MIANGGASWYDRRIASGRSGRKRRRHSDVRCEMKRLYVCPEARGKHLGSALVAAIIAHARQAGYREMVLDTLVPMQAAISLYKRHGFEECAAYYRNPMADVIYMRRPL